MAGRLMKTDSKTLSSDYNLWYTLDFQDRIISTPTLRRQSE